MSLSSKRAAYYTFMTDMTANSGLFLLSYIIYNKINVRFLDS